MKTSIIPISLSIIALLFTGSIRAQSVSDRNAVESRLRHDVTVLASDSLHGREAGTPGEQMAASYIQNEMKQIGLLPKGDSAGSFLGRFRMSYPVIFRNCKLVVNNTVFEYIKEFGATDFSSGGSASAELINAGNGNSIGTNEISGKIVILDIAVHRRMHDENEILDNITRRINQVAQSGASGIVLHNASAKKYEDLLFGSPFTQSVNIPVVYITRLSYEKIQKLSKASCSMAVEIDRTIGFTMNVAGFIDNKSDKTVVVGAHYDHLGLKKGKEGELPLVNNGADDNASGTATMLELARWAAKSKGLKYNYLFIAFSAEEKGLFGSKAFCSRPWVNNSNIVYMLNLDMVGRLGCEGDTIKILGMASSTVWDQVIDNLPHPNFDINRINGAPPFSDHAPFLKKMIPVIYFTSGLHSVYHTPADDTETLNFQGMEEIVAYIRQFMLAAEELPSIPFKKISTVQRVRALFSVF